MSCEPLIEVIQRAYCLTLVGDSNGVEDELFGDEQIAELRLQIDDDLLLTSEFLWIKHLLSLDKANLTLDLCCFIDKIVKGLNDDLMLTLVEHQLRSRLQALQPQTKLINAPKVVQKLL
jgi:hypothetical protein